MMAFRSPRIPAVTARRRTGSPSLPPMTSRLSPEVFLVIAVVFGLALAHVSRLRLPGEALTILAVAFYAVRDFLLGDRWRRRTDTGSQSYVLPSEASPTLLDALLRAASRADDRRVLGLAAFIAEDGELRPVLGLRATPLRPIAVDAVDPWLDPTSLIAPRVNRRPYRLPWWNDAHPCALFPLRSDGETFGFVCVAFREAPSKRLIERLCDAASEISQVLRDVLRYRYVRTAAAVDMATGCLKREPFLEHLRALVLAARTRGQPVAVMFFDLDALRQVNNNHGHIAGDRLIAAAGAALRTAIRDGANDAVCRWGGDEFAAVITDGSPEVIAPRVVKRIDEAIATVPGAREVGAGCSAGWAIAGQDDEELADVIQRHGFPEEAGGDEAQARALGLVKLADERMYVDKRRNHEARPQPVLPRHALPM